MNHARTEELASAFRLLFAHRPPAEQDASLRNALHLIGTGDLDPEGVLVRRGPQGVEGVVVCQAIVGHSALVWPPVVLDRPDRVAVEDDLLRQTCDWLRQKGTRLAQALLPVDEASHAGSLLRHGFSHITDLVYLRHDLLLPTEILNTPARLTFEEYDPARPAEFHATLERTYEGTLDCPEVNGVRSIEEVIAGHQAQGRFDSACWWLARLENQPAGVLLLIEVPESGDRDVSYMGLVPAARGRGLGRELLLHGLCEARAQAPFVTLSVDARNTPAQRLYQGVGFQGYDRRQVFLAIWR